MNMKMQVVVASQSMCMALRLSAYLVVVMDTQFYNGKIHAYEDVPITSILHMIGLANRPRLDQDGASSFAFIDFDERRSTYC